MRSGEGNTQRGCWFTHYHSSIIQVELISYLTNCILSKPNQGLRY